MDYSQVDLDDLIEMGSFFSCTPYITLHAIDKLPVVRKLSTSPTLSEEGNKMPPDTHLGRKI